jgi:exosome complex protein LRP1
MSDEYSTPQLAIQSFKADFLQLQDSLKPLFSAEWEETREKLGTLERAKMDIMLAYAINDLVWSQLSRHWKKMT